MECVVDDFITLTGTDMECAPRCMSCKHASELITSVTKGTERQTLLFLSRCYNPGLVRDVLGRLVLHVAASCRPMPAVIEALAKRGDLAAKDRESGWTALHRAFFYGQLTTARLLIMLGANPMQLDNEGLSPFDLIMKDRLPYVEFVNSGLNEVFTWGENANSTLGHENVQRKFRAPEAVGMFIKQAISIRQVAVSKYHTVFLSDSGQVFTCGHGLGGRLGHDSESACVVPRLVETMQKEVCTQISAGHDHTLFLTEGGAVYSCGLNTYHQLGQFPPPDKCLTPKLVNAKSLRSTPVLGICARRFHSVLYLDQSVLTFGLNAGQLGHLYEGNGVISQPRPVSSLMHPDTSIMMVTASDAATIVLTSRQEVFALHQYQCRKIVSKSHEIRQVCVTGGHLQPGVSTAGAEVLTNSGGTVLTVLMLTSSGKVLLWQETDQVVRVCSWLTPGRSLNVVHVALSVDTLALVTKDGEAFIGDFSRSPRESAPASRTPRLGNAVEKEIAVDVSLQRVALIHRATNIFVDRKGSNYAVLQSHPNACLTSIPVVCESAMHRHLETLLKTACLTDLVHDIILQVGTEKIPAHRFILSERSEYFRCRIHDLKHSADEVPILHVDVNIAALMSFHRVLTFLYTDTCDLLTPGHRVCVDVGSFDSPLKENTSHNTSNGSNHRGKHHGRAAGKKNKPGASVTHSSPSEDPIAALKAMARLFSLKVLLQRLEAVHCVDGVIQRQSGKSLSAPRISFNRQHHTALLDVDIEVDGGVVIPCHKCVLDARLEYFHGLFSATWIETSAALGKRTTLKLPISAEVLNIVLDFLYTDNVPRWTGCSNLELVCNVLAIAEQLLIVRLKELCEVAIVQLINLRNVCELLQLADVYNANQLKVSCHQFISINLAALLEMRALDDLSDELMSELAKYYTDTIPSMSCRQITPYPGYPDHEYLEALEQRYIRSCEGTPLTPASSSSRKGKSRRKHTKSNTVHDDKPDISHCPVSPTSDTVFLEELDVKSPELDDLEEINCEADLWKTSTTVESLPGNTSQPEPDSVVNSPQASPSLTGQVNISRLTLAVSPPHDNTCWPEPGSMPQSSGVLQLRDILAAEMAADAGDDKQNLPKSGGSTKKKKMSQSDRKRLVQKSAAIVSPPETNFASPVSETLPSPVKASTPSCPWGSVNTVVKSFKDLMLSDEKDQPKVGPRVESKLVPGRGEAASSTLKVCTGRVPQMHPATTDNVIRWGLFSSDKPPTTPTSVPVNPLVAEPTSPTAARAWQIPSVPSGTTSAASASCFADIIHAEMQQDATLQQTANKSLALIQIEERAMAELLEYYRATDDVSEHITVERVRPSSICAKPTWAAKQ